MMHYYGGARAQGNQGVLMVLQNHKVSLPAFGTLVYWFSFFLYNAKLSSKRLKYFVTPFEQLFVLTLLIKIKELFLGINDKK